MAQEMEVSYLSLRGTYLILGDRFHLGKGRVIPYRHPKFHSSVEERMDYTPLKYKPRAIYLHDQVTYV